MEDDDFVILDVINIDQAEKTFPWYELSETELLEQLSLLYKDNTQVSKTFARSISRLVIDSQKTKSKLGAIFKRNFVLPVVHEQLVSYDVTSAEKIKKKTFNHREIIFVPQDQRHEYQGIAYAQVFDDETFLVNASEDREIIDKNDLTTYPLGLQQRMVLKDERLAVVGFILDHNLIGNTRFIKFSDSNLSYGTSFIRKMYSHVPWKLYTRNMLRELDNRIQEIDKFIHNNRLEFTINLFLKILALPKNTNFLNIRDSFFIEIAKVMKKFYPSISVDDHNSYTAQNYYNEISSGIDIGRLGKTFLIIHSLQNENVKATETLKLLESLVDKKDFIQKSKASIILDGGKTLPLKHDNDDNNARIIIAKGLIELFKNDLISYYRIISNEQIRTNSKKTENSRSLKDQIYRSLILNIYGNTRYNEINVMAKYLKNSNFFELVTEEEKVVIENKYKEIIDNIKTIRNTKCGHIHIRRNYDLLELSDPQKHKLFLSLKTEYAKNEISSEQRNNKQIICKNDGLIIGCEHEYVLALLNTSTLEQKEKYREQLEKTYLSDDESFDSATCAFCGRKIEESKVLLVNDYDDLRQPKMFFRLTMSQSHDIESSIIRAIQKNEPLKGVDDLTQRMNAIFLWEDVRRIFDYTEASITKYYSVIEAKRDHLEKIYKELSKVCVIYSHITYEIITFRANSASYLSTSDMPWKYDIADLTNPAVILKRCMTMIRLRFGNLYSSVDKIKKGMFQEYIGKIYMQYVAFRGNNRIVVNYGSDRWVNVFYKKTMSEIINDQMILLSKTKDKEFVIMAEESIYKHNIKFSSDVALFYKESKELIVATEVPRRNIPLLAGHEFTEYHLIPATFLLADEPDSLEEIKPIDYNKYGVKQNWVKILLTTNDNKIHEYGLSEYNKIKSAYNTYFASSYNAENVLPENYILENDASVKTIDYKNSEDELKSKKKKETYTEDEQEKIRELMRIQKSVADMHEYQTTTQNVQFGKLLAENVSFDKVKGYIISDYKQLLDKFKHELALDNAYTDATNIIVNKIPESELEPPIKREKSTGVIYFKEQGNSLIHTLTKALNIQDQSVIESYYERIQILGRRTIQEAEEVEQYSGISEYLKGLTQQEINELHSGFQIDKIKMYIRIIYQSLSMIHNATESEDTTGMYDTSQGKFLIRYVGKIKIPYSIIQSIGPKIRKAEKQKNKNDELTRLFTIFYETCISVIKISTVGADLIKDLIDYFLDQDKDVNLSIKFIDYNLHLKEAIAQFRYDKERFKQKQLDADAPDELMVISEKGEVDINDDAIVYERNEIPENKKILIDEYKGVYRDYRNNIHRLDD